MNAIKFANAELHLEEITATSDNKLVTVIMNGKGSFSYLIDFVLICFLIFFKGDVKKIVADEGATDEDRVQALNFCSSKVSFIVCVLSYCRN